MNLSIAIGQFFTCLATTFPLLGKAKVVTTNPCCTATVAGVAGTVIDRLILDDQSIVYINQKDGTPITTPLTDVDCCTADSSNQWNIDFTC